MTDSTPATAASDVKALGMNAAANHRAEAQASNRLARAAQRRKQPPMVMRSALTGTWYVVTRYKHLGDGRFEAIEKHLLARESADQLEALTNG